MKMLAATFSDSAPLAFITRCIAEVIQDREQRRDKDDGRQHLERKNAGRLRAVRPKSADHDAAPQGRIAKSPEHEGGSDASEPEQLRNVGAER
jgi:hypothetical protein